jgi:hypothetical protein
MIVLSAVLRRLAAPAVLGVLALAPAAGAQGALSMQGFGYGSGQLGTRALATGGAVADLDAWSAINPAAIAQFRSRMLAFQVEPEYREVITGSLTERSSVARYPLVMAAAPAGERWMVSVSSTTLLDRSWKTEIQTTQQVGGDLVTGTATEGSNGAINDLRLGVSYSARPWLNLGAGLHGFSGRNLITSGILFPDTARFTSFSTRRDISYGGKALSAGAQLVSGVATMGVSYRRGGSISAEGSGRELGRGRVPDRVSITGAYTGLQGTVVAARVARDGWTALQPLGDGPAQAVDAWDTAIGAEVEGPSLGALNPMRFRVGLRNRTLPYRAGGNEVTERSLAFGTGLAFSQGRIMADLAGVNSRRTAGLDISERAWTVSFGLSLRP